MGNAPLEAVVTDISQKGLVTVEVADIDELKRQAAEGQLEDSLMIKRGKLLFPPMNLAPDTSLEDLTVGTRVRLMLTVDGGRPRANQVSKID
jgi:hypothetical protein